MTDQTPQATLPSGNPTDVLGGITPAGLAGLQSPQSQQGTGALETAPAPVSGGASIGDMLRTKGVDPSSLMPPAQAAPAAPPSTPPATKSPFVQALAKGTNDVVKSDPAAAKAPGGWARAVLGGAFSALGNIETGIGDAAAVGTVPAGGGALTGIARTLGARNQRLTAEKQQQFQNQQEDTKNKAMIAEANVRMIHEQKLVHQMDEAEINQSIDIGTAAANKLKTGASPAPVIAEGLTSDELKKYLASNKIDPSKETAFPTGRKVVGQKPDGSPLYQTTYTAMGLPQDVTLKPDDPNDKGLLADMNKYSPRTDGGKWGEGGPQTLSGAQYNWIMQEVSAGKAQSLARDKTLLDQGMEKEKVDELKDFNMGPDWTNALSNAPGHDPVAARNAILSNPTLAAKYKNLDADISAHYPGFGKMLDDYQKKIDAGMEQITKQKEDLMKAHGEDAASMAAGFQAKLDDPATPPALRTQYTQMLKQANDQSKASLTYDTQKKQQESDIDTKISDGDMDDLIDMAKKYETDPDKLFSSRMLKGQKQKAEFEARMHRDDPSWSFGEYRARYNTKNDFRPEGKGGQAKSDLNTFALHTGDANNLIESLRNTGSPLLNTPLNKFKQEVLGQPQFLAYRTAISAAAENYINFLLSNKAKHASDDELAEKLKSDTTSPSMAQAMMRQMANTIAVKGREFNKTYKDQMGEDIPELLDPNTVKVLQGFGVDTSAIFNTGKDMVAPPTNNQSGAATGTWGTQFGAVPRPH